LTIQQEGNLLIVFYDSIKSPSVEDAPPVLNVSSPLIEGIEAKLKSNVPVIGAGLVGDYDFRKNTTQFCGAYADSQSVVGILLSGGFKPYFRIMHGCSPLDGVYHKITKIEGSVIYELDGRPIIDMIDELYGDQRWRHQHPVDLLTIGINYGRRFNEPEEANYVNRLITGALPDGKGVAIFEPDLEHGAEIQFMLRDNARMIESAKRNSLELMEQIRADGKKAIFGLYIDCAGRTAEYSNTPSEEAAEVQKVLNRYKAPMLGFYSGVEIAPFLQKSRGLDWTGVLLVLAE
jgi:small ligand-binding sensory domain FIST